MDTIKQMASRDSQHTSEAYFVFYSCSLMSVLDQMFSRSFQPDFVPSDAIGFSKLVSTTNEE